MPGARPGRLAEARASGMAARDRANHLLGMGGIGGVGDRPRRPFTVSPHAR